MKPESDLSITDDHSAGPAPADPLEAVQVWPGAGSSYSLSGTEQQPTLAVTVCLQPDSGLPGPVESPRQAALLAADRAKRYQQISSQLHGPGVTVSLLTSLDPALVLPVADGVPALRRCAAVAELSARAAATATAPALAGIATLGELLERYGLPADRVATANADLALNSLLAAGQPLARRTGQIEPDTIPADISTLAQVASRLRIAPERLLDDNRGLRLAADPSFVLPGIVVLPEGTITPYLTQAGDTLTALARRFGTTAREIVTGNAQVSGVLLPDVHVEVTIEITTDASVQEVTASTDTAAGDSFGSLCTRLAEQSAGFTLDAVADALDRLGPVLAPGAVLSCPLAVLGGSRDGDSASPLTAVDVAAEHGCPPAAFAAANAALLGLVQPGVQLSIGGRTVVTAEQDTLNAVLGRLAGADGAPSFAQLLADSASTPLFRSGARALLPPPPVTLAAAPGQPLRLVAPAVPLRVTLRLERTPTPATADPVPPAERADTVVSTSHDRDALVDACLTVLPTVRLATDARDQLWAVSFGSDGIASVRIEPSAGGALGPRALGLPAPYPQLLDFDAPIRAVTPHGSLDTPTQRHFSGLDVEPWARSFLADLDRYLSEPISAALPDADRVQLFDVRRRVAAGMAAGLAPLLAEPDGTESRTAQAALADIAQDNLMPAYGTVIAQYRAVAVSPYGHDDLPPAELVGALEVPGRPDLDLSTSRIELGPSTATCTFAVTSADPAGAPRVSTQPEQSLVALRLDSPDLGGPGSGEPSMLRFVRPLAGSYGIETVLAELPTAELPLPLRQHATPLSVAAMTAAPSFPGPGVPTLVQATYWTAGLSYTHQHAPQDVITLSWSEPAPATNGTGRSMALAQALAAYTAAAAELAALICPDGPDTATAAASLVELATAVATAWAQHWTARDGSAPSADASTGGYRLRARYLTQPGGQRMLDRLIVHRASAEYGWPVISLTVADRQLPLTPGPVSGQLREYLPAEPSPLDPLPGSLTVRLEWSGLCGAPQPDAWIYLRVERNAASPAGDPISPAFLLTAPVQQVEVARPAVRWREELPLTGATLGEALQNAFDAVVGEQPDNVRLSVEAGYAEPVGEHRIVLPVLLVPEFELAADSADIIAGQLAGWQRSHKPATAGADWQVRLVVLSPYPDEPPILAFDQLTYPVPAGAVSPA